MSDMKHDFGASIGELFARLFPRVPRQSALTEDALLVKLGIKEGEGSADYLSKVPNGQERLSTRCRFVLQQSKSDVFSTKTVSFNPFGEGNNANIGIIQDCGPSLFDLMGSKNLITFGSVLDQAGKPVSKKDNPRAYIPATGTTLTFPACVLGFDSGYVGAITISNFTGKTVTCSFEAPIGTPNITGARINSNAGYFLSIAAVNTIGDSEKPKYVIGKALGDALQTISTIDTLPSGTLNQFYPVGAGRTLSDINGTATSETIGFTIINTCDRLEHARNFAAGKSSTLSSGGQNGSPIVFDFISGLGDALTDDDVYRGYLNRFSSLISTVDNAWEILIQNIKFQYSTGIFNIQNSTSSGGLPIITTEPQNARVQLCLKGLVQILETFRIYVLLHFINTYNHSVISVGSVKRSDVELLAKRFEQAASVMHALVPSANNTLNKYGRITVLLQIFKGLQTGLLLAPDLNKVYVDGLNVYVKEKFRAIRIVEPLLNYNVQINGGIDSLRGSYQFRTQDIYARISRGGPITEPFMTNLFGLFSYGGVSIINYTGNFLEGVVTGGATTDEIFGMNYNPIDGPVVEDIPLKDYDPNDASPLVSSFINAGGKFNIIHKAFEFGLKHPASIVDHTLFFELLGDFCNLYGFETNYEFPQIVDREYPIPISKDVAIFNFWACGYNSNISMTPIYRFTEGTRFSDENERYVGDVQNELSQEFLWATDAFHSIVMGLKIPDRPPPLRKDFAAFANPVHIKRDGGAQSEKEEMVLTNAALIAPTGI
jgi:hypothetical protein